MIALVHFRSTSVARVGCWVVIALAYAVAFLQRVAPQTIVDQLAGDFNISAQGVSLVAAAYFAGYTVMQFPAGILVDAYGVRPVMLASLAASTGGSLLFSHAPSLEVACIARAMLAAGDALVFTALIKYVALSFSDARFGLISGLSQVSGYIGGIVATTPLATAVAHYGWRPTFSSIALVTFLCLAFLWMALPLNRVSVPLATRLIEMLRACVAALGARKSWGCALIFSGHFAAITTFSGVWGIPLLMHAYGQERAVASSVMMGFMVSTMVGSIFFGYFSDRVKSLFRTAIGSCLARIVLLGLLIPSVGNSLPFSVVISAIALLGFASGGTVPILLKCLKKVYDSKHIGLGGAINTTVSGIIMVAVQPIIGRMMKPSESGSLVDIVYSHESYNSLMSCLVLLSCLGIVGPILLRRFISETK